MAPPNMTHFFHSFPPSSYSFQPIQTKFGNKVDILEAHLTILTKFPNSVWNSRNTVKTDFRVFKKTLKSDPFLSRDSEEVLQATVLKFLQVVGGIVNRNSSIRIFFLTTRYSVTQKKPTFCPFGIKSLISRKRSNGLTWGLVLWIDVRQ